MAGHTARYYRGHYGIAGCFAEVSNTCCYDCSELTSELDARMLLLESMSLECGHIFVASYVLSHGSRNHIGTRISQSLGSAIVVLRLPPELILSGSRSAQTQRHHYT